MKAKWLWILFGIYISANMLWADCIQKGNDIECDNVTNRDVSFEIKENGNVLRIKDVISSGSLTLTFLPNISYLYMLTNLDIKGGSVSINYDAEGKHSGIFEMSGSANLALSSGSFKSNVIANSSINGITISGGTFTVGHLENNANLELTNGILKVVTLENSGITNFGGGNSNIENLSNTGDGDLAISGSGNNTFNYLTNNGSMATISGGTNTITNLSNTTNLIISGGTNNTITHLTNNGGTATISGGINNITNLSNVANLNISNGTNTITTFTNTKGTATISGGINNITNLLNTSNLIIGSDINVKQLLYNSGTTTLNVGITLDSTALFNNSGTLSGGGMIRGGIFNHYGKFNNFNGSFNNLDFNNYTNLTIAANGDLKNLNVNNFANNGGIYSKLSLESTLITKGFNNGILSNFTIKSGGTLTINAGGTITTIIKCDDNSDKYKCNGDKNKTYTLTTDSTASNAGGFFNLESGGKVDSKIDFSNTGYLTIDGGEFSVENSKALKNEGNGVIALKSGTIKANIENISGSFNMSGGTIENTLKNNGNFKLSGGTINGAITNEGGNFAINSGITSGTFTNKVREETNTDLNGAVTKSYKGANLIILGSAKIDSLTNESQNGTNSVISIEGGKLESANLTNVGLIQAIRGSLNATNLINNNGGTITAYSGGSITAQSFQWGNGIVNYINGNNGLLDFKGITISANQSTLNMDFSSLPLVFGAEYRVIKSDSNLTSLDSLKIISNVQNNLSNTNDLTFNKSYKDGYIVISTAISNANAPLKALLSTSALQTLGNTTNQFDALKRLDSSEVLSNIISNPTKVVTELKNSNEQVATNHTKNSHLNLATSLNTLNRLNKHTTPKKLAFSDILKPNYRFSLNDKQSKNPLIRFANFNNSNIESVDDNATFTLEDLKKEYDEEVEVAKLKYNQLVDYTNNLYASIFGIFGNFGGIKTNAYGLIAGYDTKVSDRLIMGMNLSYANINKAHNIGIGGYGRAFVLNNEIDFGMNFNYALTEYTTQILGYTQNAKFSSFGINANVEYGYLFNVYKTQFFKPFGGLNFYYTTTPNYKESGKYGRAVDSQHSFEMSFDLGAEYRIFLQKYYYLFAQIKFEQFVLNTSNGLNMSFVGDGEKFEFAKYKGYKNYLQFLIGGDFAVIKDTLNITANVGYKMTVAKSSVDGREIGESYISANVGIKYLF